MCLTVAPRCVVLCCVFSPEFYLFDRTLSVVEVSQGFTQDVWNRPAIWFPFLAEPGGSILYDASGNEEHWVVASNDIMWSPPSFDNGHLFLAAPPSPSTTQPKNSLSAFATGAVKLAGLDFTVCLWYRWGTVIPTGGAATPLIEIGTNDGTTGSYIFWGQLETMHLPSSRHLCACAIMILTRCFVRPLVVLFRLPLDQRHVFRLPR